MRGRERAAYARTMTIRATAVAVVVAALAAAEASAGLRDDPPPARPGTQPTILYYQVAMTGEYEQDYSFRGEASQGTRHVVFRWRLLPDSPTRVARVGSDFSVEAPMTG